MESIPALSVSSFASRQTARSRLATVEVGGIDDPQPVTFRLLVDRNLAHAMADAVADPGLDEAGVFGGSEGFVHDRCVLRIRCHAV